MRLLGETFPLLVHVGPMEHTEEAIREMAHLYEEYFERGERYAVLSLQPRNARIPGPRERKRITDWTTSPRVTDATRKLCVASSTVLPSAIVRGVFTAMLWIWSPPVPVKAVARVEDGLDHCLNALIREGLALPRPASTIRAEVLDAVRNIV